MKILITGAAGQDGIFLTRQILQSSGEHQIFALGRDKNKFLNRLSLIGGEALVKVFDDYGQFLVCDVTNKSMVTESIETVRPDVIFHLAAVVESLMLPDHDSTLLHQNMDGLLYLLEACDKSKISPHIINAGSSLMFGQTSASRVDENTPFKPMTPYGVAKVAAHQFANIYRTYNNQNISTAILFNHESIFREERWLPIKIIMGAVRIKTGDASTLSLGTLDAERDWSDAEDIVDGLFRIMKKKAANEDFVLGSGQLTSITDLLNIAFGYLDLDWRDFVKVDTNQGRKNDVKGIYADISKAASLLDWQPLQSTSQWITHLVDHHMAKVRS